MTRAFLMAPIAVVTFFCAFAGTAFAAQAVGATVTAATDDSILEYVRPVYEAFASHQYALMAALSVILIVALLKKVAGTRFPWLHTDLGGSMMALATAAATAMSAGLVTPGTHITIALLKTSLLVGITAAGGFAVIKNLIIDPILKPLGAKYPWLAPVVQIATWIFDKPSPAVVAAAAGDAAVATTPATGAIGIVGTPVDVK